MGINDSDKWNEDRLARSKRDTEPAPPMSTEDERITSPDLGIQIEGFRSRMETLADMPRDEQVFAKIFETDRIPANELNISRKAMSDGCLKFLEIKIEETDVTYVYMRKGCGEYSVYFPSPVVDQETGRKKRERMALPEPDASVLLRVLGTGETEELYRWEDEI